MNMAELFAFCGGVGWFVFCICLFLLGIFLMISPLACWIHTAHLRADIKSQFKGLYPVLNDTNRTLRELLAYLKSDDKNSTEVKQYVCDMLESIASSLESTKGYKI